MRKAYISPDLETINFTLRDVVLSSPTEVSIPAVDSKPVLNDDDELSLP